MLKITRKPGEGLTLITSDGEIYHDFELNSGKQIKVAIDAPDKVEILRNELIQNTCSKPRKLKVRPEAAKAIMRELKKNPPSQNKQQKPAEKDPRQK